MRALSAVLLVAALSGCGGAAPQAKRAAPARSSQAQAGTIAATGATAPQAKPKPKPKPQPKPKPRRQPTPKPDPGSLPQTDQLPSADTRTFHAEMARLWAGVQSGSLARAMPAFFPEGAYVQVKAIGDPQGDYTGRLVADYRLDLAAAHALLGAYPGAAELVGVRVPRAYAHWVAPGVCANRVGYYEVPNARVLYRRNGAIHSFGIASMISWRGIWYVVHLGAILRRGGGGVVDDPSVGVGASVPSSTC